ncbi:MAG: DUF3306 domain-containing protein [Burkholderiales bacterium]
MKKETFFSRWSRLKKTAEEVAQNPPVTPAAVAEELPSLESLTIDSDFSGFFRAKIDENLRRAALKKLLRDPHFNVMDGLDVYIDDYSLPDPIPETMLEKLEHVRDILRKKEEPEQEPQTQLAETETPKLADGPHDEQEKT